MMCDNPFWKRPNGYINYIPLPCGKCPPCKKRRVNEWVTRLMKEKERHLDAHFVTLTYDNFNVPITPNGYLTLVKTIRRKNKHGKMVNLPHPLSFAAFMKRLRKMNGSKIKYYGVGEYGSRRGRPHYHAIVFGVSNPDYYKDSWNWTDRRDGFLNYIGDVHVGTVTRDSIAYTCSYINKGRRVPVNDRDDRLPEYSFMSKGLGSNYLTRQMKKWHTEDVSRNYVVRHGGYKSQLPKYYRDRIYNDVEKAKQRSLIREAEKHKMDEIIQKCKNRKVPIDVIQFLENQKKQRIISFNKSKKS